MTAASQVENNGKTNSQNAAEGVENKKSCSLTHNDYDLIIKKLNVQNPIENNIPVKINQIFLSDRNTPTTSEAKNTCPISRLISERTESLFDENIFVPIEASAEIFCSFTILAGMSNTTFLASVDFSSDGFLFDNSSDIKINYPQENYSTENTRTQEHKNAV